MIEQYVQGARQRFTEFGGFEPVEREQLGGALAMWSVDVLVREEPGLTTVVGLVPALTEAPLLAVRDGLVALAKQSVAGGRNEATVLLVIPAEQPLTQMQYDDWQGLKVSGGQVRLVPWIADLVRGRLFTHSGPPFGVDQDLAVLAAPIPEEEEAEAEFVPTRQASREIAEPRPWLSIGLIALLASIWVLMTVLNGSFTATEQEEVLVAWGAARRPLLWEANQSWRLFTANWLHIGIVHLVMNCLGIWWLGRAVEALYGRVRYLYIYLVAGVAGAVGSAALGAPIALSAGASTAIYGLMGAIVWYRLSSPLGERIAWRPLLTILGINLAFGLTLSHIIDNWAHLGGLAGGLVASFAVGVPVITGMRRPRLGLPRPLQWALAAAFFALAGAAVLGLVEVPGPGRDLARAEQALEAGRPAEAEAGFARALRRQPDHPGIRSLLIVSLTEQSKCQEAREELKRLEERSRTLPWMEELRAEVEGCRR